MNGPKITRNAAFLVAMFAALLSAVCPAQAGGFMVLWHTTKSSTQQNPVATVMADIIKPDGNYKGSWGAADPSAPAIKWGDRLDFLLASAIRTTARPGDNNGKRRESDEFQAKFGVRTEWYKPCRDGGIPYRYEHTPAAGEFNENHLIAKIDPKNGNSPSKYSWGPCATTGVEAYRLGSNVITSWVRVLNGSRDATVRDFLLQFAIVHHDDAWIQIQIIFVVEPRCEVETMPQVARPPYTSEPMPPRFEQPAPQAPSAQPDQYHELARDLVGNASRVNGRLDELARQVRQELRRLKGNDERIDAARVSDFETLAGAIEGLRTETTEAVRAANDRTDVTLAQLEVLRKQLNAANDRYAKLAADVEVMLRAWREAAKPTVQAAPSQVSYTLVFVRSQSTECWEADTLDEVRGDIIDKVIFLKYRSAGKWVTDKCLPATKRGKLAWVSERGASADIIGVRLCAKGVWQDRTWTTPTKSFVIVPIND